MKRVFCSQYNDGCCDSCHGHDEFFKMVYKGIEINHCCSSYQLIKWDIDRHSEEPLEKNCE